MFFVDVEKNGVIIMKRMFDEKDISFDDAITLIKKYVTDERLNKTHECIVRGKFISEAGFK